MKQKFLKTPIFIFSSCLAIFIVFLFFGVPKASAAAPFDVTGYAWSSNIGWISFNGTTDDGYSYGVVIDSDGKFSGYAWSSNIGWISFNPCDVGSCGSSAKIADLTEHNSIITGWARALNYGDGWDGCISLSGTATDGSSYGVRFNAPKGEFSGYAWGSDVIGWISFNCSDVGVCGQSDYKVGSKFLAKPMNLSESLDVPCCQCRIPKLSWDTMLYDASTAYDYEVKIIGTSVDKTKTSASKSWTPGCSKCCTVSPYDSVSWNAPHKWQVRVKRTADSNWSDWSDEKTFTTLKHCYPQPQFILKPENPSAGEIVQLCSTAVGNCSSTPPADLSYCYTTAVPDTNPSSCSGNTFKWTFSDPADIQFVPGSSNSSENPQIIFKKPESGGTLISLNITDGDGYSCTSTMSTKVNYPLPGWKEIKPTE